MSHEVLRSASGILHHVPGSPDGWRGPDRRRSLRVGLGEGLSAQIAGVGPCRLREVSLGGGMLQVGRKLRGGDRLDLLVDYQGFQATLPVRVYQSDLYELFYDAGADSRLSFRARVVCCDASIEGLNLLYRIMRDHWSPWRVPVR